MWDRLLGFRLNVGLNIREVMTYDHPLLSLLCLKFVRVHGLMGQLLCL